CPFVRHRSPACTIATTGSLSLFTFSESGNQWKRTQSWEKQRVGESGTQRKVRVNETREQWDERSKRRNAKTPRHFTTRGGEGIALSPAPSRRWGCLGLPATCLWTLENGAQ
ncbi:unnamed protein product, partial [Ixodes pacificus]